MRDKTLVNLVMTYLLEKRAFRLLDGDDVLLSVADCSIWGQGVRTAFTGHGRIFFETAMVLTHDPSTGSIVGFRDGKHSGYLHFPLRGEIIPEEDRWTRHGSRAACPPRACPRPSSSSSTARRRRSTTSAG